VTSLSSSMSSDSEDENHQPELDIEEVHHHDELLIDVHHVQSEKKPIKRKATAVMCLCLPHDLRVYLKSGVPMMTMIACFIYDLGLFLIFSVNILYHDDNIMA
jgi:hypothetical protein